MSLSVSWGVPEFPRGEIEFYQVEYSSQCSSTAHMNTSSNITEAVLSGLSPFTEYRVRVRAFTVEFGDFSMDQTAMTDEDGRLWLDMCNAWRRVCAWAEWEMHARMLAHVLRSLSVQVCCIILSFSSVRLRVGQYS